MFRDMDIKIVRLRDICIDYEFEVQEGFYLCPLDRLEEIFNGCGPDWLPEFFRNKLSAYLKFFESAFLEHDFSFECSDRTREGFKTANNRLYCNSKKLIAARYSWWVNPVIKSRRYLQARAIYKACANFGWSAWLD
jgi:hypothetical protein